MITLPLGPVTLEPSNDHRIFVHAGAPARASCVLGRYVTTAGEIDLVPAGASDACVMADPFTQLVVSFSPALLQKVADEASLDPRRTGLEPRYHMRDSSIEHIAWALDIERAAGRPGGTLYAESLGVALAVHLLRGHSAPPPPRSLSRPQLRRVTEYIEANLDGALPLLELAALTGSSLSHFKASFRRAAGMPVHRYVVQRRVERAVSLLRDTERSISEVALEVGFTHASHLARWMRRERGITPSSIRDQRPRKS